MNTLTVVHLVMVILTGDATPTTQVRQFPSVEECKRAEQTMQDAAKNSIGVLDIGTICVKSNFDVNIKPRA